MVAPEDVCRHIHRPWFRKSCGNLVHKFRGDPVHNHRRRSHFFSSRPRACPVRRRPPHGRFSPAPLARGAPGKPSYGEIALTSNSSAGGDTGESSRSRNRSHCVSRPCTSPDQLDELVVLVGGDELPRRLVGAAVHLLVGKRQAVAAGDEMMLVSRTPRPDDGPEKPYPLPADRWHPSFEDDNSFTAPRLRSGNVDAFFMSTRLLAARDPL